MKKNCIKVLLLSFIVAMLFAACGDVDGAKDDNTAKHERNKDKDSKSKDKKDKKKDKKSDKKNKEKRLTKKDIDIDELKENDGEMFVVRYSNWGEVSIDDDFWSGSTYTIYYDGTIILEDSFNLSGDYVGGMQLSDSDYIDIYLAGINAYNNDYYEDNSIELCDGTNSIFTFISPDGDERELFRGMIYEDSELAIVERALQDYRTDIDVVPVDDGKGNDVYGFAAGSWQAAYLDFLTEQIVFKTEMYDSEDIFDMDEEYPNGYYIYDIMGDKTPELIIKYGSCEADYTDKVYRLAENGEVEFVADIWSGHSAFYTNPDGGIIRNVAHMGEAMMETIKFKGDELKCETIFEESGYDKNGNWNEDFEYTDVEDVVDGAEYIEYIDIDDFRGITEY